MIDINHAMPSHTATATQYRRNSLIIELGDDLHSFKNTTRIIRPLSKVYQMIYFLGEIILGYELLVVIIMSVGLTWIVLSPSSFGESKTYLMSASNSGITILGGLYSFALVFRTNICYSRWWEGRILWGLLIYAAIGVAQLGHVHIENKKIAHRVASLAICFAFACKAQLRDNSLQDDEENGMDLVAKGYLSLKELEVITNRKEWEPYYLINAMQATIKKGLALNQSRWSNNSSQIAMEKYINSLSKAIGGCIRIRSTGLPVAYDDILNTIGVTLLTIATLAWANKCQWYNPVIILTIFVNIKLLVGVGNKMEDPFQHTILDLPLGKFCIAIEDQICAIETRNDILIGHPEFLSGGLVTFGPLNFDPISPPFSSPDEYDTNELQ